MATSSIISSKHPKMTNELYSEVVDVFNLLSEDFDGRHFPSSKLLVGLKALGIEKISDDVTFRCTQLEPVELREFCKIVAAFIDEPFWCASEMSEIYHLFDKDNNGFFDADEVRRVFTKLGESLTTTELEEQLKEFCSSEDCHMVPGEFYKMILSTKGADYIFDES